MAAIVLVVLFAIAGLGVAAAVLQGEAFKAAVAGMRLLPREQPAQTLWVACSCCPLQQCSPAHSLLSLAASHLPIGGALVIGSLGNGLDLSGAGAADKLMFSGGILLLAVSIDALSRQGRIQSRA